MTEPVSCANWPRSVRELTPAGQHAQVAEEEWTQTLQAGGVAGVAGVMSLLERE